MHQSPECRAVWERSELTIEVATAHKVAGMFGRRDPMRRYMDRIIAMIDEIGAHHFHIAIGLCVQNPSPADALLHVST